MHLVRFSGYALGTLGASGLALTALALGDTNWIITTSFIAAIAVATVLSALVMLLARP
ncbi:MAG: hypothetical protein R3A47_07760 [Polyangiales bacterium]